MLHQQYSGWPKHQCQPNQDWCTHQSMMTSTPCLRMMTSTLHQTMTIHHGRLHHHQWQKPLPPPLKITTTTTMIITTKAKTRINRIEELLGERNMVRNNAHLRSMGLLVIPGATRELVVPTATVKSAIWLHPLFLHHQERTHVGS